MHSAEAVNSVLLLREGGLGARRIASLTGIPVCTVSDWIAGKTPRQRDNATLQCARCGARSHLIDEPEAYSYLLGLYLGDGHISAHPRAVLKLRIFLDDRYPGIIASCQAAMGSLVPNKINVASKVGCSEVYAYSKGWACLFPPAGPGPKHERRIVLEPWQRFYVEEYPEDLTRGLIHSDGCRFENQGRDGWRSPRYKFSNHSADIRRIFCEACDVLRISWTEAPNTIYVSRNADVARLDEFVGPKR